MEVREAIESEREPGKTEPVESLVDLQMSEDQVLPFGLPYYT
ncbi:MAG: hypothetical protein OXN84_18705 [Albidovulum sp.]|nr:hypothetical protein [Albidovulum sp.]